jgi:hypothetical protein
MWRMQFVVNQENMAGRSISLGPSSIDVGASLIGPHGWRYAFSWPSHL